LLVYASASDEWSFILLHIRACYAALLLLLKQQLFIFSDLLIIDIHRRVAVVFVKGLMNEQRAWA